MSHFIVLLIPLKYTKNRVAGSISICRNYLQRFEKRQSLQVCFASAASPRSDRLIYLSHPSCTTGLDPVAAEAIPRQPDIKHRSVSSFKTLWMKYREIKNIQGLSMEILVHTQFRTSPAKFREPGAVVKTSLLDPSPRQHLPNTPSMVTWAMGYWHAKTWPPPSPRPKCPNQIEPESRKLLGEDAFDL